MDYWIIKVNVAAGAYGLVKKKAYIDSEGISWKVHSKTSP